MVYRPTDVRHGRCRCGSARRAPTRWSSRAALRCSHFDAYRFFTEPAAPLNAEAAEPRDPGRHRTAGLRARQHGPVQVVLQAGPLVPSELLMDCFELAARARELDMRASPYDLAGLGIEPIAVEDAGGRTEYVRRQRDVADRSAPLRAALLDRCDELLAAASPGAA